VPRAKTIIGKFLLSWIELVGIARGELDLETTLGRGRRKIKQEGDRNVDGLVGTAWIGVVLGLTDAQIQYHAARSERFPLHVATLGYHRVWLRADVEAYRRKRPVPLRRANELQHLYLDRAALARLIGISWKATGAEHAPHLPKPAGEINGRRYWRRANVDEWLAAGGLGADAS
jgi:predicted DNA-binding transcriptional regulator AlpA